MPVRERLPARLDTCSGIAPIAAEPRRGADEEGMTSRLLRLSRPAAAFVAAAAIALAAPAASLASSQTGHSGPTAHIALGLMDSHSMHHHVVKHHAVKRHAA
jgi:hypothetical protein